MADKYTNKVTDCMRLARSLTLAAPSDDTYNLIRIPENAFIIDVWVEVSTAFGGASPTLSVGWMGNGETSQTSGFMTTTQTRPQEAGMKRACIQETDVTFPGKWFTAAGGAITATCTGGSSTGTFTVFVLYAVIF